MKSMMSATKISTRTQNYDFNEANGNDLSLRN